MHSIRINNTLNNQVPMKQKTVENYVPQKNYGMYVCMYES
jgi:hypothetical protein